MIETDDEAPSGRKLGEQGNTDAKLFVPDDAEETDEQQEGAPQDAGSEDEDLSGGGDAA